MIDIIKTIFLGIIQGITEWLPISSTGHLILFSSIWPLEPAKFFEVFKVVIQFGSILAVLVLCIKKSKNRIIHINTGILSNMKQKIKEFYH